VSPLIFLTGYDGLARSSRAGFFTPVSAAQHHPKNGSAPNGNAYDIHIASLSKKAL
jgi:hypothetical protein